MIDQQTVDRIIDTAQIVDVVSDFVSLKKRGANYIGLCPFHNEKTPSFSVSASKNICKCFSCGKGGNPVHFVMEHEQMSFVEALRFLAKKYNIEIKEKELTQEELQQQSARESMLILNSFAQKEFTKNLFDTDEGMNIGLSYFHERGFRNDIINKFQLGYSLEQRDHFCQTAQKNGFSKDALLKTGLATEGQNGFIADRFRGRVIFPILSLSGKVLGFGGRILKNNDKLAKYVNSPESEIYHKSNELYGIFFAKQSIIKQDSCFLVEGYTDVLSMHQAGIENVVASSGTSLTPGQIRMIHRFTSNVTVLYDGDAAGIKASLRGIDLILKEGLNVKVVLLPDGEDPDSYSKKHSASEFLDFIKNNETDFIHFKTKLLIDQTQNDPVKRAAIISDIVRTIAIIPDRIIRSIYVKEASRMLDIQEEILLNEIKKLIQMGIQKDSEVVDNSVPPPDFNMPEPEIPVPSDPNATPGNDVKPIRRDTTLDRYERTIIRYVVKFGEKMPYTFTDEQGNEFHYSVIEFILSDLENDSIVFNNPVYQKMLDLARVNCNKEGFVSQHFFFNNQDIEISKTAIDLVAEKYTLSKIHTKFAVIQEEIDILPELIKRSLYELKDAIIRKEVKDINAKIKQANSSGDVSQLNEYMNTLMELHKIRTELAKELGERIVTRF